MFFVNYDVCMFNFYVGFLVNIILFVLFFVWFVFSIILFILFYFIFQFFVFGYCEIMIELIIILMIKLCYLIRKQWINIIIIVSLIIFCCTCAVYFNFLIFFFQTTFIDLFYRYLFFGLNYYIFGLWLTAIIQILIAEGTN